MFFFIKVCSKRFFYKIGINNFATKVWFNYFVRKHGLGYTFDDEANKIVISKKNNELIITGNTNDFAGLDIVLRDFDNVFKTVNPQKKDPGNLLILVFLRYTVSLFKRKSFSFMTYVTLYLLQI